MPKLQVDMENFKKYLGNVKHKHLLIPEVISGAERVIKTGDFVEYFICLLAVRPVIPIAYIGTIFQCFAAAQASY